MLISQRACLTVRESPEFQNLFYFVFRFTATLERVVRHSASVLYGKECITVFLGKQELRAETKKGALRWCG